MNLKVKDQISGAEKDAPHDAASGMIIELDGTVLEQIAGGETGMEPKLLPWTICAHGQALVVDFKEDALRLPVRLAVVKLSRVKA